MIIRRWFCCGYGIKDEIIDPRNSNSFIEDVMDPYGRQDKCLEELRKKSESEERRKEELFKYFKDNKKVVDCLYEKMEKGEIYKDIKYCSDCTEENVMSLKKMDNNIGDVIKLKGVNVNNNDNIKIQIEDTHDEKRSKRSDSSNSLMDFDVECHISGTEI